MLNELRSTDYQYSTVTKSGTETTDADKIVKVVAYLKDQKATATTKLADQYKDILEQRKKWDTMEEIIKDKAKPYIADLFNAGDAHWTRVLETASVTFALSKETSRKDIKFDKDKFIEELLKLTPELKDKIDELVKECTKVKETAIESKLNVALKEESISNVIKNAINKIKEIGKNIYNKIKDWGKSYDNKLDKIKDEMKKVGLKVESKKISFKKYYNA